MCCLCAGSAAIDITPQDSQFLYGYPHVERYSTGIHDPLLSSALYLFDGLTHAMFIANDLILMPKSLAMRVRSQIENATSIPACNIMITATHTHSSPNTEDNLCDENDPVIPKTDANYIKFIEERIAENAIWNRIGSCESRSRSSVDLFVRCRNKRKGILGHFYVCKSSFKSS